MSTFKDAAEVYEYLGKMFEIAVNDPRFVRPPRVMTSLSASPRPTPPPQS
jgi:hypothetical protein